MVDEDVDPYDKGREAMDALFDVLEGEIIPSVEVTKKGVQYPRVEMLISEYPIQELEVFPKYFKVGDTMIDEMDLEDGESAYWENVRLAEVEKLPGTSGHNLQVTIEIEDQTEGPIR